MPTPDSESPEAFGSPVPAYSVPVLPSYVRVPIALMPNEPDTFVHAGVVAIALSVRQMPPPAAASHMRQTDRLHLLLMASAVTRPETCIGAAWKSKKFSTFGCVAVVGPTSCQALPVAGRRAAIEAL